MSSPKAATPAAPAAAPSNRDDLYEMAIQYKKEEDFSGWYTDVSPPPFLICPNTQYEMTADLQVLIKGQMLDYYDISGCYILRPGSFNIWQTIQGESTVKVRS